MKFTPSHEWIEVKGEMGCVGITDHAQEEIGEIVHVELPSVGRKVRAGEEVAIIESTKAAADIYAPVSGEIVAINPSLGESPCEINHSAEKRGWLFKMRLSDPRELDSLLSLSEYSDLVK